ncbi:MAG TPA: hypothetical protein VGK86_01250 [Thermoanaerobaculia bacterium]
MAPVVSPESLNGRDGISVAVAQVSPPAAIEDGFSGLLAPMAIRPLANMSSVRIFDRIVIVPTLELEIAPAAHPEAEATV